MKALDPRPLPAGAKRHKKRHEVVVRGVRDRSIGRAGTVVQKFSRAAISKRVMHPFGKVVGPFRLRGIDLAPRQHAKIMREPTSPENQHVFAQRRKRSAELEMMFGPKL